ncbi:MAG: CPBP family intramembrane glutamic endopeptidase [Bacteroidota bacterium]
MNKEIQTALLRVLPFLVALFVISYKIRQKKINSQEIFLTKPNSVLRFLLCVFGFIAFALLIEIILYYNCLLEIDTWNHPLLSSVIRITGAVILAPIVEELLFRGFILTFLLKKKLNVHLAVAIQAVFFVLLHNFTYQNTFSSNLGIAQGYVDASLFAYARNYTKSLYTPITMHMSGNLIATLERFVLA